MYSGIYINIHLYRYIMIKSSFSLLLLSFFLFCRCTWSEKEWLNLLKQILINLYEHMYMHAPKTIWSGYNPPHRHHTDAYAMHDHENECNMILTRHWGTTNNYKFNPPLRHTKMLLIYSSFFLASRVTISYLIMS